MDATTSVLVVDDHPIFRDGMVHAIDNHEELHVAGVAPSGDEALSVARRVNPDVALVDVKLAGRLTGIELIPMLHEEGVERILVISASDDGATVVDCLAAGADGFVSKAGDRREICAALLIVASGDAYIPRALQRHVAGAVTAAADRRATLLSARETEVLHGMAAGVTYEAIGRDLYVSAASVKTYAQRIYEKLGVSDRGSAVAEAFRRGLLR